jgi:hypothetical protein
MITGELKSKVDREEPEPGGAGRAPRARQSAQRAEGLGMINPTESLAFSMHANPGVYAVLVGSGVSRAAKIPTGWEITLDLIEKLAALRGEKCDDDPATPKQSSIPIPRS